jgi:GntR family transcriptional regulator/MocR family aminotransferase
LVGLKEPVLTKQANQFAQLFAATVWRLEAGGTGLRAQLYRQLRDAVTEGRVAPGAPVPSTRELAIVLGVSRSTLVEALDQLRVEGYLETRQGSATRIATLNVDHLRRRGPGTPGAVHRRGGTDGATEAPLTHERWRQDDPPMPVTLRAFRPGLPDIRAFPAREWATHLARRARQPASHDLSYVGHAGVPALREQIVRHVAESRHVVARPEQVVVLPSAQAAFDVAIRCTLRAGDVAWVEDPGYPGMRTLLRAHGATIVPVAVDAEGMRPASERSRPRLVYLTPSHQYPTGTMLSLPRRLELLDRARRSGAVIIEDDFDSEFQIRGQPIASLQGLDRAGCVHYVGTFSKSLAPGVRVAYLIVPPRFAELAETIATAAGLGVSIHLQLALADFMADGGLRRHIHRMRAAYGLRLTQLHRTLAEAGVGRLFPAQPSGGLQLCAALPGDVPDTAVVDRLRASGLHALPLSTLCHGPEWTGRSGLLLGIGLVGLDEVEPQARALCAALASAS